MSGDKEKFTSRIVRYLRNLLLALLGNNPYQMELDDAREKLAEAAEKMQTMQKQYYTALEKWDESQRLLTEANSALEAASETASCKQLRSMQRLVENLRERVREKDAELEQQGREFRDRMEQVKADYQRRIDEYVSEIDQLRNISKK